MTTRPAARSRKARPRRRSARDGSDLLRLIAEGTAGATGEAFFRSLVRCLAEALDTPCAFVTEFCDDDTRARPLAFWHRGGLVDAPDYPLAGTPCELVLSGEIVAFSDGIRERFPRDRDALAQLGAESYLAIPVRSAGGKVLGHLAVIAAEARDWGELDLGILRTFGARTAGELERRRYERALEEANTRLQHEVDIRVAGEAAMRDSERAYRELYEDAPVAYWTVDTQRIIRRVNKQVSAFLGYPREEIVGQPLSKFTAPTPHGEAVAREVFARFLRGEATIDQEVEFRRRDGGSAWASVSVTPVFDEDGKVHVTRSVVVDITERKRAERDLQHRLDLETLIATASSRFVRAGPDEVDAEIDRCMQEVARFFGVERMCVYRFTPDERAARHTHAWISPEVVRPPDELQCGDLPALFRDVLEGRVIGARNLDALPADYADLRARLTRAGVQSIAILPLDYSHRVLGMLLLECARAEQEWSAEDLRLLRLLGEIIASTLARRDAEGALDEARRAAEAASRAKSEFLASMSHELRTPLNGILGYAQLLARDPQLDPRHRAPVQGVQQCGEHLLGLVNEILDLARIESGRVDLHPEDTALGPLVAEIADIARVKAAQAGLGFVYETGSALPHAVRVDPRRLKQILINLLGNAVKFTPAGEVRFRVGGTRTVPGRWRLEIEVTDTGVGIPEDELPHIFDPFHRAPADRAIEGTGLGLAITQELVTAMGGHMRVASTPGRGSTFVVDLEMQEVDAHAPAHAPQHVTGYEGPRRTLLVADDKADNRAVLRGLLEPLGFDVHEASTGREALDEARRLRPDLVLLDLVMPELDGFEVARRLRLDGALATMPIVAVSASVFDDTRQSSLAAGCDDFIAKPVQLDTVLETLERRLGLRWRRAEDAGGPPAAAPAADERLATDDSARLYDLARVGDVAELNARLDELAQRGDAPRLVARLRALARAYDMKAIRDHLQQMETPP